MIIHEKGGGIEIIAHYKFHFIKVDGNLVQIQVIIDP